jgi:putative membrane protein
LSPTFEFVANGMKLPPKIQITVWSLGLAGAALFTALLIRQGLPQVGAAVATAGWGIVAVAVFHLIPIFLDGISWWVLFPKAERPALLSLFWMRTIGESVSNLVPSAMIGGDIVRARLAAISGAPLALCVATVIADVTVGIVAQIIFTLMGLLLLVVATGYTSFVLPTVAGMVIGIMAAAGFYFAQRLGMFRFLGILVTRLVRSEAWSSLVQSGEMLDQTVRAIYARGRSVLACFGWTLISLVISSAEMWIALHALGAEATLVNAVVFQSMAMTVRSGAFAVPGQLGVQEGGYLIIGSLLHIPGDTAFALSLIARFRDLAIGIPGVVAWQLIEARRFWRARLAANAR